jgi:hypothetical protein
MGRVALLAAAVTLFCAPCYAYTPTLTQDGKPVRWQGEARLELAGNPSNQSGLSPGDFFTAVTQGLQRWKAASGGTVDFDYWQGTDPSVYEPNSDYNGLSSIYFASAARGASGLSSNVLGLTQVWYDTDNGQILETDIVLNDQNYHFTMNPRDTSGYGSSTGGAGRNVYVGNVITHELGHAFGLSHSGGLQSTMLFMESPEQAFLGCDEQIAIHALYPDGSSRARGAITGAVLAPSRAPIFGAHVLAISRRRGTVLATAITDRAGHYRIAALEPGAYYLLVEPFFAGSSALPAYYSGMNVNVCGGHAFSRTLLMAGGVGAVLPIEVSAGSSAKAPAVTVRCENDGGAAVVSDSDDASIWEAPAIYDGASGAHGFGMADRFTGSGTLNYKLTDVKGHLEIHALSYTLYSPVHASLELYDSYGNAVQATRAENIYQGESGYVNYDSALVADDLPEGDYELHVSSRSLRASLYPAGPLSVDNVPFLLITGSVNEQAPSLASTLPFNGRCRMDENFAQYHSPPGPPKRHSLAPRDPIGFCGIVARAAFRRGGPGGGGGTPPSASAGAIVGWFLPWVLMALLARWFRWRDLRVETRTANVYSCSEFSRSS